MYFPLSRAEAYLVKHKHTAPLQPLQPTPPNPSPSPTTNRQQTVCCLVPQKTRYRTSTPTLYTRRYLYSHFSRTSDLIIKKYSQRSDRPPKSRCRRGRTTAYCVHGVILYHSQGPLQGVILVSSAIDARERPGDLGLRVWPFGDETGQALIMRPASSAAPAQAKEATAQATEKTRSPWYARCFGCAASVRDDADVAAAQQQQVPRRPKEPQVPRASSAFLEKRRLEAASKSPRSSASSSAPGGTAGFGAPVDQLQQELGCMPAAVFIMAILPLRSRRSSARQQMESERNSLHFSVSSRGSGGGGRHQATTLCVSQVFEALFRAHGITACDTFVEQLLSLHGARTFFTCQVSDALSHTYTGSPAAIHSTQLGGPRGLTMFTLPFTAILGPSALAHIPALFIELTFNDPTVPLMRLVRSMQMTNAPSLEKIVTMFTMDGRVLEQNLGSEAYMGAVSIWAGLQEALREETGTAATAGYCRSGSVPGSGNWLQKLFALDPGSLEAMMAVVKQGWEWR